MTSDKASEARRNLDYALGKKRVKLGELYPSEFDKLLEETLQEVDLRELRGFKPLKDHLTRHPGSYTTGQRYKPMEVLRVAAESTIGSMASPTHETIDFSTHVVSVARGVYDHVAHYRRHESGEETTDWKVAQQWGSDSCYVRSVSERILVVRRPNNHTYADENLFEVWYECRKVPHADEMVVTEVSTVKIPVSGFRSRFQEKYPQMAQNLIWELASLTSQTMDTLRSQASSFERTVKNYERLSGSISD